MPNQKIRYPYPGELWTLKRRAVVYTYFSDDDYDDDDTENFYETKTTRELCIIIASCIPYPKFDSEMYAQDLVLLCSNGKLGWVYYSCKKDNKLSPYLTKVA